MGARSAMARANASRASGDDGMPPPSLSTVHRRRRENKPASGACTQPPDRRRPFRFGMLGERIRSCDGLLAQARRGEALSYATLLLRDRFMREPFGDQLAPMVALAAAAGATRTLRVGTLVLDND